MPQTSKRSVVKRKSKANTETASIPALLEADEILPASKPSLQTIGDGSIASKASGSLANDCIRSDEHTKLLAEWTGLGKADMQRVGQVLREALEGLETKFFTHQGEIISQRDLVSWKTRLAAVRELVKLFGLQPSVSSNKRSGKTISVDVEIHPGLLGK